MHAQAAATLDDFIHFIDANLWALAKWPSKKMAFAVTSTAAPGSAPALQARAGYDVLSAPPHPPHPSSSTVL